MANTPGTSLSRPFAPRALRGPLIVVALAVLLLGAAAPPMRAQQDGSGNDQVTILVRSTLAAVHHANLTGNYTVLRDLGSPRFYASNTAARLAQAFAPLREQGLDLYPALVLQPQLSAEPGVGEDGMLRIQGFYPGRNVRVTFDLRFENVNGVWKLFGVSLNTVPQDQQ